MAKQLVDPTSTVNVDGNGFDKRQCCVKAVESARSSADFVAAWLSLAQSLSDDDDRVEVSGQHVTNRMCFVKALELNPNCHQAWFCLGQQLSRRLGPSVIEALGQKITPHVCFTKVVRLDPTNSRACCKLGETEYGVAKTTSGDAHALRCFVEALQIDLRTGTASVDELYELWCLVAELTLQTVTICNKTYTKCDCVWRALTLKKSDPWAWAP